MKGTTATLLCVVVVGLLALCSAESSNRVTIIKELQQQDPSQNLTAKCVLCGLVINELEALLAENLTESAIEQRLQDDVCGILGGELRAACDGLVDDLPNVINRIENINSASKICVDDHFCEEPFTELTDPQPVPIYTIDLDLLPAQRWKAVCTNPAFVEQLQIIVSGFEALFGVFSPELSALGKTVNTLFFPIDFAAEIRACASDANVDYGWLTILNMVYEIVGACTSIVSQTVDNKILHVRNLDFWDGIWLTNHLKNITFTAEYYQNGKFLFHATQFAGYFGVFSGMKPQAFSVSIDTRRVGFTNITEYAKRMIADITHRNATLTTYLIRKTFMESNDYPSAVKQLSNSPLIGDAYYIVGGVSAGQGAVISRNPVNATDVWTLDPNSGRWFEVETNYDHWTQPPWFDDRVVPANRAMNALGRGNLTLNNLFTDVLSIKPVLNIQSTFTMLACAAEDSYTTLTRYCPYPCAE